MVWPITGAESYVGKMGESMKADGLPVCLLKFCHGVVMDNRELQNSVAKIAEALITTQRNLVTVSRSLWAVRISIRELHPDFEEMYLNHFAEPEHAFDTMRDNLLDYGRELAHIARRLRAESSQ